jgi:transposase
MYMYIERIKTKTSTGKLSHVAILLRESFRENGKVRKKTIANLTHVKPEILHAYEFIIKNKHNLSALAVPEEITTTAGKSIGAALAVAQVAKKLRIEEVLGQSKEGKLALYQIIARCLAQGSRLSSVRLNNIHNMSDVLGIDFSFTEDHLYQNLVYIFGKQKTLEQNLFLKTHREKKLDDLFLYDVTSSYFEGVCNELSDWGFNKDKKKGKKQVVMGLLCDKEGDPVSVDLFRGNTSDIKTFSKQTEKVKKTFGCQRVTFVTDRGIIKGAQMKDLESDACFYITAITKAQIEHLLKDGVLQLSLFDDTLSEVVYMGKRLIFRRNPKRAEETRNTRQSKITSLMFLCEKKNRHLTEHPKAKTGVVLRDIREKIVKLKCQKWLTLSEKDRVVTLAVDQDALREEAKLDGCYVMKTNLPESVDKETINSRYKDLIWVERAFRTEKTGLLELRPWFVITEESSRSHAFIVMLAYKIIRFLGTAWKSLDITVEEGLAKLATITTYDLSLNGKSVGTRIAKPDDMSAELLSLAGITLPESLPHFGAIVASRKKLQKERK